MSVQAPLMNAARRTAAVLIGCLAGLVLMEGALRYRSPEMVDRPYRNIELGWASPEYEHFQPRPRALESEYRLLALGDSYLDSRYRERNQDQRFTHHLEAAFPERLVTQVLASPGWGTDQQLIAFRSKGARFEPDLVLLCICTNNDLIDIKCAARGDGVLKPFFQMDGDRLSACEPGGRPALERRRQAKSAWLPRSALVGHLQRTALEFGFRRSRSQHGIPEEYLRFDGRERLDPELFELAPVLDYSPQHEPHLLNAYLREPTPWTEGQWKLLAALLGEFQREVLAVGARLAVLRLPMTLSARKPEFLCGSGLVHQFLTPDGPITLDLDVPGLRLAEICKQLGIELLDPTHEFHAVATSDWERFFDRPNNRHWSCAAHVWLAQYLAPMLEQRMMQ